MNKNTLIIKLGASGDVVRTTPLLRVLEGDVTWVTEPGNITLLPADRPPLRRVLSLEDAQTMLPGKDFDLVLCLDDEREAAELASRVKADELVGAYTDVYGAITYTDSSAEWFDMGLISKHGKPRADEIKMVNTRTYQEILFGMLGLTFRGEESLLRTGARPTRRDELVGIEARAGDRWPTKKWHRFDELAQQLRADGYEVRFFKQRDTIEEYIADIDQCGLIITGDSLALHVALALQIPTVAIFTCTSSTEIHGYGRMSKVVSPKLNDAFYKRGFVPEAVEAIRLKDVYDATKKLVAPRPRPRTPADGSPAATLDPMVVIIVVNWNGKNDLLACLRSLSQVIYARYEIVVVDNDSHDGSVGAIRREFPHVTLIENDRNEMFARANNQGMEYALDRGADFALLLNNDTEVSSDFISKMIEVTQSLGKVGMVGAKIYFHDDPKRLWYAGGVVNLWKGLIAHVGIRELDQGQYDIRQDTDYITGCCILVSRECMTTIGLLDDSYRIYGEDVDWCQRARLAEFRVMYQPAATLWHKVSSSTGGKTVAGGLTPFKIVNKTHSMFRFFVSYAAWYQWLTIPFFAAGYAARAAWLMVRSGNWAGIGAMFSAVFRRNR